LRALLTLGFGHKARAEAVHRVTALYVQRRAPRLQLQFLPRRSLATGVRVFVFAILRYFRADFLFFLSFLLFNVLFTILVLAFLVRTIASLACFATI
jgi:hypothetical protein